MPNRTQSASQKKRSATILDGGRTPPRSEPVIWTAERQDGSPTVEVALYASAIAIGILSRVLLLDSRPLSVEEGGLAAQAYRIMMGQFGETLRDGPLPSYGTAMFLSLFAAADGAARMLSVVSGACLVGVPYLLRRSLGRTAALAASWGFALSPVLLFASRTVGSGIVPALLTLLLWWTCSDVDKGRAWRPLAIALLLAGLVTSGPAGLTSVVALGLAALLSTPDPGLLIEEGRNAWSSTTWRRAAFVFAAATIAIGAALGADLRGVQYVLVDVWASWLGSTNLLSPRGGPLLILALYELPVLFLAFGRLVVTLVGRDRTDMLLALWAMILLLIEMIQPDLGLPRMVLPLVPLYLMVARSVAGTLSYARGASMEWKWMAGVTALAVPTLVGMVIMNRSTMLSEPVPQEFVYGEVALVLCAVLLIYMLLDDARRKAAIWYYLAFVSLAFWLHTTAFLNYRTETAPSELLIGQQISAQLRQAALDDSYHSRYFNAPIVVDPQLRVPLEWYLRSAMSVDYSADGSRSISIELSSGQSVPPAGSERAPGLFAPALDSSRLSWQGLWGWAMSRTGLVRPNPRDIILRIPMSVW